LYGSAGFNVGGIDAYSASSPGFGFEAEDSAGFDPDMQPRQHCCDIVSSRLGLRVS